ncbi:MAG: ATP-binding protein [Alphaproteobacteria bacterium]|nr:ATP-binding protein [Alphaproteobacteria bacterium]
MDIDPGNYVMLGVSDGGYGIAEETLKHVFEPFFTTKSKGTGLGMAIAKRIVDSHGGAIAVANAGQA